MKNPESSEAPFFKKSVGAIFDRNASLSHEFSGPAAAGWTPNVTGVTRDSDGDGDAGRSVNEPTAEMLRPRIDSASRLHVVESVHMTWVSISS
jgi:hypothetical protein